MRTILGLNQDWIFTKTGSAPETVHLPHTWNNVDGQDGGNDYFRGIGHYSKKLTRATIPAGECFYLELRGANSSADVFVNGNKLAHHDGGYSTWRVNITDCLADETLIEILVDNSANETVYPQAADFTFYGGLYRDVNLIAVPVSHFELEHFGGPGIAITPEVIGKNAKITTQVYLTESEAGQMLRYILRDAEGRIVADITVSAMQTKLEILINDVHLWNGLKDPYLYTAEVQLLSGGTVIDNVSTRFGCRIYAIDPEHGFILNGEEYALHGVSRHQDWWGRGNALLPEHHKRDMDLICEMGANTIRLAHYQHDQYFYDLCDERGLVVWAEIPYITKHMPGGRENTISQMKELVIQNYNHPSVIVWGLSNEITMISDNDPDMLENHRILNDLCHKLDSTRLTTMAVLSMCNTHSPYIRIPDIVSFNHYFGWYGGDTSMNGPWFDKFHGEFPEIPVGLSEYGCEALNWHTSEPTQGDYTEEYQAYYHEELIKQIFSRKYLWATHVWNMFDFGADARNEGGENGQNHKGLVTFDRQYKKDAFYAYKAWMSDEPFVHICGKRYVERAEAVTKITVYSNQPEVEMFVNGQSVGKQKSAEHFFYFDVPNNGESVLRAVAGLSEDESRIRKVKVFNESYRLKENGSVLNWFDITTPEGYFSLNDKLADILKNPQGMELFNQLMQQLKGSGSGMMPMQINKGMMQMMGGFTVIRLTSLMGAAGVKLTKEQLISLNAKLNLIPKR